MVRDCTGLLASNMFLLDFIVMSTALFLLLCSAAAHASQCLRYAGHRTKKGALCHHWCHLMCGSLSVFCMFDLYGWLSGLGMAGSCEGTTCGIFSPVHHINHKNHSSRTITGLLKTALRKLRNGGLSNEHGRFYSIVHSCDGLGLTHR